MRVSRTFKAKVLGTSIGMPDAQIVQFADIDDEFNLSDEVDFDLDHEPEIPDEVPKHDLADPFQCLDFVMSQVRQKHTLSSILDFHVTMRVLTTNRDGSLEIEEHVVRPWKEEGSDAKFRSTYYHK